MHGRMIVQIRLAVLVSTKYEVLDLPRGFRGMFWDHSVICLLYLSFITPSKISKTIYSDNEYSIGRIG